MEPKNAAKLESKAIDNSNTKQVDMTYHVSYQCTMQLGGKNATEYICLIWQLVGYEWLNYVLEDRMRDTEKLGSTRNWDHLNIQI